MAKPVELDICAHCKGDGYRYQIQVATSLPAMRGAQMLVKIKCAFCNGTGKITTGERDDVAKS